MRIKIDKTIVPYKLTRELIAAGVPVIARVETLPNNGLSISLENEADRELYIDVINVVIAAHDGIDDIAALKAEAETRIRNIPNWATWTEAQAFDWFTANIEPLQIPQDVKTLLFAYGRLLLALRDNNWPELNRS